MLQYLVISIWSWLSWRNSNRRRKARFRNDAHTNSRNDPNAGFRRSLVKSMRKQKTKQVIRPLANANLLSTGGGRSQCPRASHAPVASIQAKAFRPHLAESMPKCKQGIVGFVPPSPYNPLPKCRTVSHSNNLFCALFA
jgi:hypothetical protein